MSEIHPTVLDHIYKNLHLFLNRDFLLDIFTPSEKHKAILKHDNLAQALGDCYLYKGKLLNIDGQLYTITDFEGVSLNKDQVFPVISLEVPAEDRISERNTPVVLPPGVLANYTGTEPLNTTIGRVLLNYVILVDPFGDYIPYINQLWNIEKIEQGLIFDGLRTEKITVDQVKHYSRNLHWIGHFTELAVPSFTEKSLTVDPRIIARRDELLKQYAPQLEAHDPVVMSKIQDELVAMDKEFLKGDPSTPFYDYSAGKSYGVHRKAMFAVGGMVENFGTDGYSFLSNSLEEGWNVKDFPVICNQIRSGSYSRAKETALGGVETNLLIRVFQNTEITEEDCNSPRYLKVLLTHENMNSYIYRNIIEDGNVVTLSGENISEYVGKTILLRSPMFCPTKVGYCYTCMGELFRTIDAEHLTMAAIGVSSSFTVASLKKMHSNEKKTISIKSLNRFAI